MANSAIKPFEGVPQGGNKHHSLLPFHLTGTDENAAEKRDRAPNRHPCLPQCEAGHTTYLKTIDLEDGEKQSAETRPDEKALRNYLGCRLINCDQSLHSNILANHRVCIHKVGKGWQDQQEQAGQSPEHGPASHTWSNENHPSP